jgi:cytochrome c-type biogenesis protein CcmH
MSRYERRTMTVFLRCLLSLLLAASACSALAQSQRSQPPPTFENEERRYHMLLAELRCVMCQNQSLADSDAQIARDLRREVLDLMREGRSDGEIRAYLVQRYGEFVLYRPTVSAATWLLWFGPVVVLALGGMVAFARARRGARLLADGAGPASGSAGAAVPKDDSQEW